MSKLNTTRVQTIVNLLIAIVVVLFFSLVIILGTYKSIEEQNDNSLEEQKRDKSLPPVTIVLGVKELIAKYSLSRLYHVELLAWYDENQVEIDPRTFYDFCMLDYSLVRTTRDSMYYFNTRYGVRTISKDSDDASNYGDTLIIRTYPTLKWKRLQRKWQGIIPRQKNFRDSMLVVEYFENKDN